MMCGQGSGPWLYAGWAETTLMSVNCCHLRGTSQRRVYAQRKSAHWNRYSQAATKLLPGGNQTNMTRQVLYILLQKENSRPIKCQICKCYNPLNRSDCLSSTAPQLVTSQSHTSESPSQFSQAVSSQSSDRDVTYTQRQDTVVCPHAQT